MRIQQAQLQHHLRQLKLEQEEKALSVNNSTLNNQPNVHPIESLIPEQLVQHEHRHNVARAVPRIVGPRLQRPKSKSSKVELAEADRRGVCPAGNEPLMDEDSGRLRLCNGLEPHCPPKSYCYVTGVASADYNCCAVP